MSDPKDWADDLGFFIAGLVRDCSSRETGASLIASCLRVQRQEGIILGMEEMGATAERIFVETLGKGRLQ